MNWWNITQSYKPVTYTLTVQGDNRIYITDPIDPEDIVEKKINTMPLYKEAMEAINKVKND